MLLQRGSLCMDVPEPRFCKGLILVIVSTAQSRTKRASRSQDRVIFQDEHGILQGRSQLGTNFVSIVRRYKRQEKWRGRNMPFQLEHYTIPRLIMKVFQWHIANMKSRIRNAEYIVPTYSFSIGPHTTTTRGRSFSSPPPWNETTKVRSNYYFYLTTN
jgi:hypothetical protein